MSSSAPKPEKGVPIPPASARLRKYSFFDLQPDESVLIPAGSEIERRRIQDAFRAHANKQGWMCATRSVGSGVRVWRLS